jgi:hypothetical protein
MGIGKIVESKYGIETIHIMGTKKKKALLIYFSSQNLL